MEESRFSPKWIVAKYVFCHSKSVKEVWPPTNYSSKVWGTNNNFDWIAMSQPGLSLVTCCKDHMTGQFLWVFFIRSVMFYIGIFFAAFDYDGEPYKNPEKMVYVLFSLYFGIITIMAVLRRIPLFKQWLSGVEVPYLIQFAWFCHDIALPSALGTFILYVTFVPYQQQQEMTRRLYGLNFAIYILEVLFVRMVLYPGHWLWFNLFMIPVSMLYAFGHFNASLPQYIQGLLIMEIAYVFTSFVTFARANLTGSMPITYALFEVDEEAAVAPAAAAIESSVESTEPEILNKAAASWFKGPR